MTTLSYVVPVAGTDLNAIADPEIATALTSIKSWANGNIDQSNIAGSSGYVRLANRIVATSITANSGDLVLQTAASTTITLPSPTSNSVVGVFAAVGGLTGSGNVITVSAGGNTIFGVGLAASSFTLGITNASVVLQGDGSAWRVVSGQQDTGYVAPTLATNFTSGGNGGYATTARLVGDRVFLRGSVTNATGGSVTSGTQFATLPSGYRPAAVVCEPMYMSGFTASFVQILANGNVFYAGSGSWANGNFAFLDGISFSVS